MEHHRVVILHSCHYLKRTSWYPCAFLEYIFTHEATCRKVQNHHASPFVTEKSIWVSSFDTDGCQTGENLLEVKAVFRWFSAMKIQLLIWLTLKIILRLLEKITGKWLIVFPYSRHNLAMLLVKAGIAALVGNRAFLTPLIRGHKKCTLSTSAHFLLTVLILYHVCRFLPTVQYPAVFKSSD